MRLRLLLESRESVTVPWDYRTDLTKTVYAILKVADPGYSGWLHDEGFRWGKRIYRLFVYSDLVPTHWNLSPQGLSNVRWMSWQIGSPDKRFLETFQAGLEAKRGRLELFGTIVEVVDMVRVEPPELGSGLVFRTASPVAASAGIPNRSAHPIYLSPDQPEFVEAIQRNLITKWQAFHQRVWNGGEFGMRVWKPKHKLIRVFNTAIRAYYFYLQMWGDEDLIRFAYDAGLGIKNSQGFGMIEPEV